MNYNMFCEQANAVLRDAAAGAAGQAGWCGPHLPAFPPGPERSQQKVFQNQAPRQQFQKESRRQRRWKGRFKNDFWIFLSVVQQFNDAFW